MIPFAYKNEQSHETKIFDKTAADSTFGEQVYLGLGTALQILHHPGLTEDSEDRIWMKKLKNKIDFLHEGRKKKNDWLLCSQ